MAFILNPYDADLDLNDKDDRKLFQDGCKGLKDDQLLDGKKENYSTFSKLLERIFDDVRVIECLMIPTVWDVNAATPAGKRIVISDGIVDFFNSSQGEKAQVKEYSDLVWANTTLGNTQKYFCIFDTNPATTVELESRRNQRRLKHIMMGKILWESLTAEFQIEISVKATEFKQGRECDGPLLWDFIRRHVNPTTTVGASKLKEDLENVKPSKFGNNIVKYNTWFEDVKKRIIKEEGAGKYNEYLRNLFRAYLVSGDKEFVLAVKEEKRKWTQGKLPTTYDYNDLMELGRLTYVNLVDDGTWE